MSARRQRLASSIERGVQRVLARGLNDPRVRGLVTITKVTITPDGKRADVGVSVLPEKHEDLTMHGLRSASGRIRREVGELIRTRAMPELAFVLDRSLKKQAEVLRAIDHARQTAIEIDDDASDDNAGTDANTGTASRAPDGPTERTPPPPPPPPSPSASAEGTA